VMGADGDPITFRIFRGDETKPFGTVHGKVADGAGTAKWKISGVDGDKKEGGLRYVEFDFEAECNGVVARTPGVAELRGYKAVG
jgi:hypothetical protein